MAIKGLNPDWIIQPKLSNPITKTNHITRKFEDIPYGTDDLQKIDIYLPEEGEGPFPTIIMVHGGGMCVCDKQDFHLYPLLFALEDGFAVASINYRLSPRIKYPTQLFDTERAILFLSDHASDFSLDNRNFFLWGTSAGGNLVLLSAMKKGPKLPEEIERVKEVPIRGVAALCAEVTMTGMGGLGSGLGTFLEQLQTSLMMAGLHKKVLGTNHPTKEQLDYASAFTYLPDGIAPLFIQHGDKDPAVPYKQSEELYQEARKVLRPEDLFFHTIKGAAHAGAGIDYFEKKNVTPILEFFHRHQIMVQ